MRISDWSSDVCSSDLLEGSNEELKSANEEYQSVNEELQSSNEELETSKEEQQSINEELQTVNAELNGKNEALGRAISDLQNLLESTQIATIFLNNELRITTSTPPMADIFHLPETRSASCRQRLCTYVLNPVGAGT